MHGKHVLLATRDALWVTAGKPCSGSVGPKSGIRLADQGSVTHVDTLATPHSYPGKLIVVEGIDGSGKTTQLSLLATWLAATGHHVSAAGSIFAVRQSGAGPRRRAASCGGPASADPDKDTRRRKAAST